MNFEPIKANIAMTYQKPLGRKKDVLTQMGNQPWQ